MSCNMVSNSESIEIRKVQALTGRPKFYTGFSKAIRSGIRCGKRRFSKMSDLWQKTSGGKGGTLVWR